MEHPEEAGARKKIAACWAAWNGYGPARINNGTTAVLINIRYLQKLAKAATGTRLRFEKQTTGTDEPGTMRIAYRALLRKMKLFRYIIEYERLGLIQKRIFLQGNNTAAQMKALIKGLLVYAQTTSDGTNRTGQRYRFLFTCYCRSLAYRKTDETKRLMEKRIRCELRNSLSVQTIVQQPVNNSLKYATGSSHIIVRAEYITATAIPHLAGSDMQKNIFTLPSKTGGFEPVSNEQCSNLSALLRKTKTAVPASDGYL